MNRSDVLWVLAFVALLLLGYGIIPTPILRTPEDSFSAAPNGKKAFYLIAQELLDEVSRSSSSLIPPDGQADTLVMLGPARYPDRAQWQTLYDWVSQGRALVFAARWSDPAVDLEPFGIEVVPRTDGGPREPSLPSLDEDEDDDPLAPSSDEDPLQDTERLVTELVGEPFDWRSAGEVRSSATDVTVELTDNGTAQVVWRPIGDGAIVVIASDYIFTNRSLSEDPLGLLAFRILETAGPAGPAYFDESMNAAGAPRIVGILLERPFRLITLQLAIVIFLFGWMASRRFGPVLSREGSARRSLVEHAAALGNLHFKVGSGSKLVSSYLEFFRRELGLRRRKVGDSLERDPERDKTTNPNALDRALDRARNPALARDGVAEIVRTLARLRDEAR